MVYFKLFVTPGTLYCFYKINRIKRKKKSKSHTSDYFSYLRLSQIILVLQYGFSLIEFQGLTNAVLSFKAAQLYPGLMLHCWNNYLSFLPQVSWWLTATAEERQNLTTLSQRKCLNVSTVELRNYWLPGLLVDRQKGCFHSVETCPLSLSSSQYVCVSSSLKQDNSVLTLRIRTSIQL